MKKVTYLIAGLLCAQFSVKAQLKQDSLHLVNLQEVQVNATRASSKTPMAYSNVSKEQIKKQNFGQDIPFLLSLTPSLVATSDAGAGVGYTGFRIRGTDASRINVTTNGIPLNDSESHGVYWVNMPDFASSLEDLQIQRGVGSSTSGAGAFGATLNMKTENASTLPYAEVNGSYGSFNTSKATLKVGTGLLNNHWAFDARLSNIHSDGYLDRATSDLSSYFAQASYFSNNTIVKLVTFGGKEKTYHAWYGTPKDSLKTNRTYNELGDMGNGQYYDNQTDNYQQNHYQLILTHVFNQNWNLNAALHYTKGKGYYEEYKQGKTLEAYGLKDFMFNGASVSESDLVQQKWLDNDFGGGVFSLNYNKDNFTATLGGGANRYLGNNFGKIIWVKNYAGDANFVPGQEFYRSKGDKTDANIYAKVNYEIFKGLNTYVDLQYRTIDYSINGLNDRYDPKTKAMQVLDIQEKFNFFNPKAGLFYHINDNNQAYASVAVAHREPTRSNYTDAVNSITPKSEELLDYEAGYTFANKRFSVGANFYYMKYKDQLILTGKLNDVGEPLTTNVDDSYRAGVEFQAGISILKWLKWSGNLTLSQNKILNFTEENVDYYDANWTLLEKKSTYLGKTDIAYSPNITAGSLFEATYGNCSIALQSNYVGKQYLDNTSDNERSIDAYFVNNLRLGYTLKLKNVKSISLGLAINNLFNEKYETNAWTWYSCYVDGVRNNDLRYFPQAGTNVLANISFKF